jgi:hypothetical protein
MNKYLKILIIVAILFVVAVLSDYLATQSFPSNHVPIFEPRPLPFERINNDRYFSFVGDLELFYKIRTVLTSINATLLVFLSVTYLDMYQKIKSEFTIGLILFSLILLLYSITSNPLVQGLFGFRAFGLGPFAMLPEMFTTLALAVLVYLTMK